MNNKKWFSFVNLIFPFVSFFVVFLNYSYNDLHFLHFLLLTLILTTSVLSIILIIKNKKKMLSKLLFVVSVILCVVLGVWVLLDRYNILDIFSSIATFKNFILSTKEKGMIVYVLIQFVQVLSVPIPSMIITLTGVAIYGPLIASILCTVGVLLGSYCSFWIGKVFGFRIVKWVVGEANATKYAQIIEKKGKFFLIFAFLLPLFPDDVLCLISGLTTMKFKTFFWIALITRPLGVICMSYFGGGYIIPFTGWGLFVWPFILILAIVAITILTKYQEKIESRVLQLISKISKNKEKESA